ncbi:ABC transporter substrate-binding protein [Staphylococcus arlettae]|uniref:ABC transporter substrate-binding protein n=1 Tax=Staphylococcus arlettae TaxID=29378 RepID=UPI001E5BCD49|nr:ABC transporter substrate-binding protein [Staphylococcus arlettae]MCD8841505.1 ABC transporter substrate-binding protein [Staphylococcus arlettae]
MKKYQLFVVLFVAIIVLAGCGQNDQQNSENNDKQSYDRIISLMPSNTEILYELGLGKQIIGVSTVDDYPKDVKNKQQFDAMKLNKEALMKAKPDLILAHESQKGMNGKVLSSLKQNDIKVVYVKDAQSISEMYDTFENIGKLTNKEQAAKKLIDETKGNIKKVVESVPDTKQQPNVFMEVSSEPEIFTAGKNTFFNDMLTQLHAKNSFASKEGWQKVSKEEVIKQNPDVMIGTMGISKEKYQESVKQRGGFNHIQAVQYDQVTTVNGDEISRPGPRIDEGLKALRDAIYN